MDSDLERKRRKDHYDDDDEFARERKSRKLRSKSRSPQRNRDKEPRRKRENSRSPNNRSKQDRESPKADTELKKDVPERKNKETDMLNTRTGGAYIPPARLKMMQAQITDKSSIAFQRLAWEALKKSIHGHINKINVGNIGIIIKQLLRENIVRGRGLLCRSVIQAQAASPTFTNVYAALVAAVNSRFPNIGELLLKRLVIQFKRGFKRNDKPICISSASFIAHLVNQRVAHEILALELLTLLVETPTDDSVEVAIAFLKECGQKLTEVSSKGCNAIFEMLRNILHEGQLDKRVQYMIEVMFQVWKDGFKDHPALIEELELVPEEEQFTHLLMLDDATDPQDILNVFKFDEKYEENEQKYKNLSNEILGSDAESGEEDGSGSDAGSDESGDEEDNDEEKKGGVTIIDNTETNLVALRRTIYLTINSSLDFEECAHKLMKMQLKPGQEVELCHMFLDCCAEQRTYEKFYGLLAQRFCNINRIYIGPFEDIFKDSYATAHRLDTNRLRNVSKFFAHLLFTDSISWEVLETVKLNEEDTTSSSRIFIKILFQELAEYMGLKKLNDRLRDPTLQEGFSGIFPRDNPKNTRFSINFFTSIGLGGLTDELREHLKQMPKNVPPPITDIKVTSESSSSSSSSSSDSSSSSSSSEDESHSEDKSKKNKKSKKKSSTETNTDTVKNKDTERWGHDGFYETYGKDARRPESRPEYHERDKDNFVVPRNPPDKNNRRDSSKNRDSNDDRVNRDEGSGSNRRRNEREDRYYDHQRLDGNGDHREFRSESGGSNRRHQERDEISRPRRDFDKINRQERSRDDNQKRISNDENYRSKGRESERGHRDIDENKRHRKDEENQSEGRSRRNSSDKSDNRRYIEKSVDDTRSNKSNEKRYDQRKSHSDSENSYKKDRRHDLEGSVTVGRSKKDTKSPSPNEVSSDEETNSRDKKDKNDEKGAERRKKKRKKEKSKKENSWDIKSKQQLDKDYKSNEKYNRKYTRDDIKNTEEFDIHRENSLQRETPERYWDSYKDTSRCLEYSPNRESESSRRKSPEKVIEKRRQR